MVGVEIRTKNEIEPVYYLLSHEVLTQSNAALSHRFVMIAVAVAVEIFGFRFALYFIKMKFKLFLRKK